MATRCPAMSRDLGLITHRLRRKSFSTPARAPITFSQIFFPQTVPTDAVDGEGTKAMEEAPLSAPTPLRSKDDDPDRNQRRSGADDDQCQKNHEGNDPATILP